MRNLFDQSGFSYTRPIYTFENLHLVKQERFRETFKALKNFWRVIFS